MTTTPREIDAAEVVALRLAAQRLGGARRSGVGEVVSWFGAVQAQDYKGALWGIGQRAGSKSEADVEAAIEAREIVRTWPMRNTLHFVAAADVGWMLDLLAPRAMARARGRYRELGLDDATFAASRVCLERQLRDGGRMTRAEAYAALDGANISPAGQRGIHILGQLAMQGVLCFGPRRDKQATFLLAGEWLPERRALGRDEALGELARRYFTSHGPASAGDFGWWTGLALGDARRAIEIARPELVERTESGVALFGGARRAARKRPAFGVHLLPPFDEYSVAYKNREAIVELRFVPRLGALLSPAIASEGRIVGTWRRTLARGRVDVVATPFTSFGSAVRRGLEEAAARYGAFLGATPKLSHGRAAPRRA